MMKPYVVSYDLDKPGSQNYGALIARLKQLGAVRILYSQWVVRSSGPASGLEKEFMNLINPATDSFLVVPLTGDSAWNKLLVSDSDFRSFIDD